MVIGVQQFQLNDERVKYKTIGKRIQKNSGFEQDWNPRPLHSQCDALPIELSKPHVWFGPSCSVNVILHLSMWRQLVEHCTGNTKVMGSNPIQSLNFFRSFFPVVLWLQSHLSLFHSWWQFKSMLPPHGWVSMSRPLCKWWTSLQNRCIFIYFSWTDAKARWAQSSSHAQGEEGKLFVSCASPCVQLALRGHLTFTSVRLNYTKEYACSAG